MYILNNLLRTPPWRLMQSSSIMSSLLRYHQHSSIIGRRLLHDFFKYKHAIVGSVNESFKTGSIRSKEPKEPIDLERAKKQHENYVKKLRNILPDSGKLVQIPPDSRYPDQTFIEDTACVYHGMAILPNMYPLSRQGERELTKRALEELRFAITEMKNPEACLDGGDVIFTGREFLIGLSTRTNSAGIEEFANIFSKWPVSSITVLPGFGVLHLKSMSSMCGIDTIAISDTTPGRQAWKEIVSKAKYKYKRLAFPDDNGANCVFVNGVVLHPSKEDYPESFKVWETLECEKIALNNSEFSKADGSLTCNSILIC